jgi:hypothetical protein
MVPSRGAASSAPTKKNQDRVRARLVRLDPADYFAE